MDGWIYGWWTDTQQINKNVTGRLVCSKFFIVKYCTKYTKVIFIFSNKEKELNNRRLAMQKIEGIKFF